MQSLRNIIVTGSHYVYYTLVGKEYHNTEWTSYGVNLFPQSIRFR